MKKARAKTIRRSLDYDKRKAIAEEMKNGVIKQVAARCNITLPYAYQIFYEFLEWKAEWKHKEIKNDKE